MIPSPRVISPGPATIFPLVFETSDGDIPVTSLKEVRSGQWNGGFFREVLPVREVRKVRVNGYGAETGLPVPNGAGDVAVRAAYCLGFDAAEVEVGFGPGGPWVLDVSGAPETGGVPGTVARGAPPEFLGARVEYLRVDPATGCPEHAFHRIELGPGGKPHFPEDTCGHTSTWVSSPYPFPEMPLTTRLLFSGDPQPWFVRLLDQTVAVLGMLVSPTEEARERHTTDEGLLGSVRPTAEGFEYQAVPSLLWSRVAMRGLIASVRAICSGNLPDGPARRVPQVLFSPEGHLAQKAYYHCDKGFFRQSIPGIASFLKAQPVGEGGADAIDGLLRMADRSASSPAGEEAPVTLSDFRPAWGLRVPSPAAVPAMPVRPGTPAAGCEYRLPVLGIMAPLEEGPRRFGIETDRFRELIGIATDRGVAAFVFFPSPWEGKGWFYRERRGWYQAEAPMPDVVYDRHIPDIMPSGATADTAREFQEAHPAVRFVNSLELVRACRDKLRAHEILSGDPFVARYLPETTLARSPADVASFASRRERTYLKIRGGTGSRGLVLLENLGSGGFRVTGREAPEPTVMDAGQLREMLAGILRLRPEHPLCEYIAQEGIDLARAPGPGEVFEVRVICQKGGVGIWLRTGMVCRLNPAPGRFMVPGEELHLRIDDLLGRVFPGRVASIKDEIREIARRAPPVLETASGRGGEISVDLGLDTLGRPHLIEVNSKPATLFRDIAAFGIRRLSLRRVVNYAIRLFEER